MNSDFRLSLHWFAKTQEWRVYADNGDYWCAKSLAELPKAVAALMRGQAAALGGAAAEYPSE